MFSLPSGLRGRRLVSNSLALAAAGIIGGSIAPISIAFAEFNPTPDFWNCTHRVSGQWQFGFAPSGCDSSDFGEDSRIQTTYGPLIYQDTESAQEQLPVYMQNLYSVIRDGGAYYYRNRVPQASPAEIQAWIYLLDATANQESYWSHYRFAADHRLKLMRGDSGHGHGLMQIDDRYHWAEVQAGKTWDFASNFFSGMDELFSDWQAAGNSSCVSGPQDFRNRSRAAWAAYNGGPTQVCRFTNTSSAFHQNDIQFAQKFDSHAWSQYVENANAPSEVDIVCLAEGGSACSVPNPAPPSSSRPSNGKWVRTATGNDCVFVSGAFYCVSQERDAECLAEAENTPFQTPVSEPAQWKTGYAHTLEDRHTLCQSAVKGFIPVGDFVLVQADVNLRATPGGGLLNVVPGGSTLQVLDFEVHSEGNRYYRVQYQGQPGYIYGGSSADYYNWAMPGNQELGVHVLAIPRDEATVAPAGGLNLRVTPEGEIVRLLPTRTKLQVEQVKIVGDSNSIYNEVVTGSNDRGWVYSGHLLPTPSVRDWLIVK